MVTDEDAYQQDIIVPISVRHLVEFGDTTPDRPGQFGFWYNFIDYQFVEDDRDVLCRHYFDEPDRAILMATATDDDFCLRILVFLSMRYGTLQSLAGQSYAAVPDAIMAKVEVLKQQHLLANGD